jgi:tryptophan-rich sensory protein
MTEDQHGSAIIDKIKAFGAFWYDFVVGDDWRVAVGVALALTLTFVVSRTTPDSWWIVPLAVVLLLPYSLWRAVRHS